MKSINPSALSLLEAERLAREMAAMEPILRGVANLKRLTEMGMELAVLAAEKAIRNPPIDEAGPVARATDPQKMFERLSRSARETIAFKARLIKRHLPADDSETRADARCTAVLDWLESEVAAARHRGPHAPPSIDHDGKFVVNGPNPN